jgi:rhamnosyltransferase subunit B
MAHILLLPVGSHGDVHPFVALGVGLRARGHRVTMMTAEPFRATAGRNGLDFIPTLTSDEYDALMLNPDLWHPKKGLRVVFDEPLIRKYLPVTFGLIKDRYRPGETVAVGGSLALAARTAHDALGIPYAGVTLQPMTCCSVVDPPVHSTGSDFTWLPKPLIRAAYWGAERWLTDPLMGPALNDFRKSLGLSPVSRILTRWNPSPQLDLGFFPDWFGPVPDMPASFRHCGFVPFDDAGARPVPPEVESFLAGGPAPVVFSFGSAMRTGRPYFDAAVAACVTLNVRGLLLGRAGDQIPPSLPPNVIHAAYAPFSDVFPRAATVVHHGGIGTSAQALRAGVPQLVMPLAFDQADNAARLKRLGVSATLFPKRFTGPNVAAALKGLIGNDTVTAAAKRAATRPGFDGLATACAAIETLVGKDRPAAKF